MPACPPESRNQPSAARRAAPTRAGRSRIGGRPPFRMSRVASACARCVERSGSRLWSRIHRPMTVRLTSLSHGGGCGCKLAPAVLEQLIARSGGAGLIHPNLLVGIENRDDAAVYRISEDQ